MNLDSVKAIIANELGIYHRFIFCGARNQVMEFEGKIIKVFPAIFIIELLDGSIKSFSYNFLLIMVIM